MRPAAALRLAARLGPPSASRALPAAAAASGSRPSRWSPDAGARGASSSSSSSSATTGSSGSSAPRQATVAAAAAGPDAPVAEADNSRIIETELRQEAERSYLSYAMSVIVGRALPDVRDGLKPVHRRILYAMHELGLHHNKPFRKCARVVGEVLGKFHPHGDTAVYDALVRLAQDFSMRLPLVDGHGNFGSIDDDPAAAMRYTECRLQAAAAHTLLADLEAGTVDFAPNFDASVEEPTVLPARLPNLLINGTSGIAVGIATKIPPHNVGEVVAGLKALIANPDISVRQLMQHIPAPDFPTGGEIIMTDGVRAAYEEGRGGVLMRAKMHIEDGSGTAGSGSGSGKRKAKPGKGEGRKDKPLVVITELPYQTNKSALVEQVARLVDDGKLSGVSDVRDESDRDGVRVVVEVKRGGSAELVQNQLLKHTAVEARFSCNMVALVGSQPRSLTLKDFLQHFLDFRCEVVERRAAHDLAKARARLHLVDGFLAAMSDLDAVVQTIRQAPDGVAAMAALQAAPYSLSREQAEGVLGLTLRRLTSLEAAKLQEEQAQLSEKIADLSGLLASRERVLQVVQAEAEEAAAKFGTPRRTAIVADGETAGELKVEDVIPNAPSLVALSRRGYIKRLRAETFGVQRLGGKGKAGARLKADDAMDDVVALNDHDTLLFFTTEGKAYSLRAYDVPEASRTAVGTAITQVLKLSKGVSVAAMVPVADFGVAPPGSRTADAAAAERDVVMLTRQGLIKRMPLKQFKAINKSGLAAIGIKEGDSLAFVGLALPTDSVFIAASSGHAQHFPVDVFRSQTTRTAAGVKTMKLEKGAQIVAMAVLPPGIAPSGGDDSEDEASSSAASGAGEDEGGAGGDDPAAVPCLLLVTAQGLGKRVPIAQFRLRSGRIGAGVRAVTLNEGDRLAAVQVVSADGPGAAAGRALASGSDMEEGSQGGNAPTNVLLSTQQGQLVRVPIEGLRLTSRIAKGQRVIKVREGDEVVAATVLTSHQ